METFRVEVGHAHGVLPGNIVGAIANEAGLDGKHIGYIDIREDHSFVDLPEGMPQRDFPRAEEGEGARRRAAHHARGLPGRLVRAHGPSPPRGPGRPANTATVRAKVVLCAPQPAEGAVFHEPAPRNGRRASRTCQGRIQAARCARAPAGVARPIARDRASRYGVARANEPGQRRCPSPALDAAHDRFGDRARIVA